MEQKMSGVDLEEGLEGLISNWRKVSLTVAPIFILFFELAWLDI